MKIRNSKSVIRFGRGMIWDRRMDFGVGGFQRSHVLELFKKEVMQKYLEHTPSWRMEDIDPLEYYKNSKLKLLELDHE